ncbi:MAG: hemolysin family protein, partial [Verrucomicrobiales bacterium]
STGLIGVLLALVAGVQFCVSAAESALFALREHQIQTIAAGNLALGTRLRTLLDAKSSRLGQALVLSALCNSGMAALGLVLVRRLQPDPILSPITLGGLLFGSIIVFCHLLPNLVANLRPRWVFTTVAPAVVQMAGIVKPFERGLQATAGWITDLLVPRSLKPNQALHDEELETLVEMRRDEGAFEDLEGEVIHEILKLGDKTAKDCMTPRVDAVTISMDLPADEASRSIREQTHRQIPVYDGKPDEIVGVLDVIAYLRSGGDDFRPHVGPPTFVPETLGAIELFQRHLNSNRGMVVVLDEFGGFEGVVSRTDVIEHLVGDVAPSEEVEIQSLGQGRFLVSGSARLDELREATGVDLETTGIDTIGGLIATELGRIPSPGERVILEPFAATIRKSTSKRVEELLLAAPDSEPERGGAG